MASALRKVAPLLPSDRHLALAPHRSGQRLGNGPPDPATIARVRAEFNEMRGFSPTPGQAARLFGLSRDECERTLATLAREGFLHLDADGRYRAD